MEKVWKKVEGSERDIAEIRALCQELHKEISDVKVEQSHMAEDIWTIHHLTWSAAMETHTLGQMLDAALGSPSTEPIDFEQLRNLLNGMLLHLGLRDLSVQETGEPLEGAKESPFSASFLEELKHKVETNEKEIIEVKAICQELREEVNEMKIEQCRLTEDLQKFQEALDPDMLDYLHNHLADMMAEEEQQQSGGVRDPNLWDDPGLIVIGNEITLAERRKQGDSGSRPGSPLHPKSKMQGRGKDLLQADASNLPASLGKNGMGQNVGRKGTGWNAGRKDAGRNVQWSDMGQNGTGQADMGQGGVGQVKDEDTKTGISKAEALPSHPDAPAEGQIKDEETKTGISKVPSHAQQQSSDGSFTTSGMDPGAPGTHLPCQHMQSAKGQPGSQNLWIPAESVAGTSSRLLTPKEARGGGSPRIESFPGEEGLRVLKLPSPEYSSCAPIAGVFGRQLEILTTPPASPGLSGRLPAALKKHQTQEQRDPASEMNIRGSPKYCGGKHTSLWPIQPMESLLPSPNKPGAFDLVGSDGLVYRGRSQTD